MENVFVRSLSSIIALRQSVQRRLTTAVQAQRLYVNLCHRYEVRAVLGIEVVQIRNVLEVVGIDFAAFDDVVRYDVIGVLDDLQRDTLLSENLLRNLQNLGVRSGGSRYLDGRSLQGRIVNGSIEPIGRRIHDAHNGACILFFDERLDRIARQRRYQSENLRIVLVALFYGKEGNGTGAMAYMKAALRGRAGRALAATFALLCVLLAFLLGGLLQANAIAECLGGFFGAPPLGVGLLLAALAGLVILGGERRIGRVTVWLIPLLTLSYLFLSLGILLANAAALPSALGRIFSSAFSREAALGGGGGFLVSRALRYGVSRGLLSNEAGCGTAPLAHATARTDPVKQGIMGMVEVFVDTVLLCTVTALVILIAFPSVPTSLGGALVAVMAYGELAGKGAAVFVALALVLFAYGTVICWAYYGERGVGYLLGERPLCKRAYFLLLSLCLFGGCLFSSALVWGITDALLSLMTLFNLLALLLLAPRVVEESRKGGLFGEKQAQKPKKEKKEGACFLSKHTKTEFSRKNLW